MIINELISSYAQRPSHLTIYRDERPVSNSKNLRGIAEYSRKPGQSVVRVIAERDKESGSNERGRMIVHFADGAECVAFFRSHVVMLDWIYARRNWRRNRVELSIDGKVKGAM